MATKPPNPPDNKGNEEMKKTISSMISNNREMLKKFESPFFQKAQQENTRITLLQHEALQKIIVQNEKNFKLFEKADKEGDARARAIREIANKKTIDKVSGFVDKLDAQGFLKEKDKEYLKTNTNTLRTALEAFGHPLEVNLKDLIKYSRDVISDQNLSTKQRQAMVDKLVNLEGLTKDSKTALQLVFDEFKTGEEKRLNTATLTEEDLQNISMDLGEMGKYLEQNLKMSQDSFKKFFDKQEFYTEKEIEEIKKNTSMLEELTGITQKGYLDFLVPGFSKLATTFSTIRQDFSGSFNTFTGFFKKKDKDDKLQSEKTDSLWGSFTSFFKSDSKDAKKDRKEQSEKTNGIFDMISKFFALFPAIMAALGPILAGAMQVALVAGAALVGLKIGEAVGNYLLEKFPSLGKIGDFLSGGEDARKGLTPVEAAKAKAEEKQIRINFLENQLKGLERKSDASSLARRDKFLSEYRDLSKEKEAVIRTSPERGGAIIGTKKYTFGEVVGAKTEPMVIPDISPLRKEAPLTQPQVIQQSAPNMIPSKEGVQKTYDFYSDPYLGMFQHSMGN